ncbi:MAG: hypothetical protein F6K56_27415, partial [Moorea sp. SIO3G5]|nr:hypothetical protein [Moorena sp. SIO3G5]
YANNLQPWPFGHATRTTKQPWPFGHATRTTKQPWPFGHATRTTKQPSTFNLGLSATLREQPSTFNKPTLAYWPRYANNKPTP